MDNINPFLQVSSPQMVGGDTTISLARFQYGLDRVQTTNNERQWWKPIMYTTLVKLNFNIHW